VNGTLKGQVLALLGALVLPATAHADVLEMNVSGPVWIAGQSVTTKSSGTTNSFVAATSPVESVANPVVEVPPASGSVTEAGATAAPEQWRGHVAALAAKYDLSPALLEALVWQESRWRPNATSRVGAHGLTQLMPGTARQLGVNIRDPLANLEGGARYLRMQLNTFGGDLEKALAAYNAGPGRVLRAGGVPKIAETQAYVASIMARLSAPVRR
jgi:soluble lytic murein transglycosylase-like protein